MYYDPIYQQEAVYLAGPQCFYTNGYAQWFSMASQLEMLGCRVTMPTRKELPLGHADKRKDADAIFANCVQSLRQSTSLIIDLEFFRGPDVDGGSLFELGMAYARGCRCYGFTRDLREMRFKYQGAVQRGQQVFDRKGRLLPYADLPFSPNIVGSCKIAEGQFDRAVEMLMQDIMQDRLYGRYPQSPQTPVLPPRLSDVPTVYLAGPERWCGDSAEQYAGMKALCRAHGLEALTPLDAADRTGDRYAAAYRTFQANCAHVAQCDAVLVNLNDFHGWEPEGDTAFECGFAYYLGKRLYGYLDNAGRMIDRVPHFGAEKEYRDYCGCNVENFNYPINLMFASAMPIIQGSLEDVLPMASQDILHAKSAPSSETEGEQPCAVF